MLMRVDLKFQRECGYYLHYHQPLHTVASTGQGTGLPHMLHLSNGGVYCKVRQSQPRCTNIHINNFKTI